MANNLHIPSLRRGVPYESLDRAEVRDHRTGAVLASVSQANAGIVRRDLKRLAESAAALRTRSCAELIAVCERAGEFFLRGNLPMVAGALSGSTGGVRQSPEEYVALLSATSGLPHTLCRRNMEKIHTALTQMGAIVRGLTRGLDLSILDRGIGTHDGMTMSYYPTADALGVVLPSNSPGVNSIWLPAIALKTPVVLKPGRDEPWTPLRLIAALIEAGLPREAIGFYPTDHEGAQAILTTCGRGIIFGDDNTTRQYAANPAIQCHGTGRSKVILGNDAVQHWRDYLDVMVSSISDNGGRSCINASCIVVTGNDPARADEIADALAKRLGAIQPRKADDPQAVLSAFANSKFAEAIDAMVTEGLKTPGATDITAKHRAGPRLVRMADGGGESTFLLPTIVRCDSWDHPLANTEFLFPFASVVHTSQDRALDEIGPSLVVSAITSEQAFIDRLLACPHIDRLNLGPLPSSRVQWDQPHEGNLFEFLYRRRAIQRS